MSGALPDVVSLPPPPGGVLGVFARALGFLNTSVLVLSILALLAACGVLSTSVFLRYFLKVPTDWQDEVSVFLLVGATFLSAAHVQARRGQIGIEAVASLLPAGVNAVRQALCDLLSLLFCAFFTWKSWTLWYEAYSEGQTTSSSWAPPLAIPYSLMCAGMTLLTLQLVLQCLLHLFARRGDASPVPVTAGEHP